MIVRIAKQGDEASRLNQSNHWENQISFRSISCTSFQLISLSRMHAAGVPSRNPGTPQLTTRQPGRPKLHVSIRIGAFSDLQQGIWLADSNASASYSNNKWHNATESTYMTYWDANLYSCCARLWPLILILPCLTSSPDPPMMETQSSKVHYSTCIPMVCFPM